MVLCQLIENAGESRAMPAISALICENTDMNGFYSLTSEFVSLSKICQIAFHLKIFPYLQTTGREYSEIRWSSKTNSIVSYFSLYTLKPYHLWSLFCSTLRSLFIPLCTEVSQLSKNFSEMWHGKYLAIE